jgi:Asp-tRNA(Asn)/Glu-tRNA(Gln) amidotransferase A subunit family amidase
MNQDRRLSADASAANIAESIRNGHITSLEATTACLDRIRTLDPEYGAFVTVLADRALEEARSADAAVAAGRPLGTLHGVPVTVKDAFLMRGTPTTIGSPALLTYSPPGLQDATCVERLRDAGAIIVGKTTVGTMDAGSANRGVRVARNPWNPEYGASGSSSGSAVAVGLGMGYASIGTDLGGSIRIPASWVGVVGLKPTHGLVSQYGDVFGLCRSYEHVGPLTRTVHDAALILSVIAGRDPLDPTSRTLAPCDFTRRLVSPVERRMRIGWVADGGLMGAEDDVLTHVETAVKILAERGHAVSDISLPPFDLDLWYQAILAEEWDGYDHRWTPADVYQAYVGSRLHRMARRFTATLTDRLDRLRRDYSRLFDEFDVLVAPTSPITAKPTDMQEIPWRIGHIEVGDIDMANTWTFNLTGHPALSLPCGFDSNGLPIGMQLAGRHLDEGMLLSLAAQLEHEVGGFHAPAPGP